MKTFFLGTSKSQVLEMLSEQTIHKVYLGKFEIALTRKGESFKAFQAECPHRGAPLHQGLLTEKGEIICSLHQYSFDLNSGKVQFGSCGDLHIYPTELTDDGLKIFISNG